MRLIATSGLPGRPGTYQPNDLFDIDWDSFEDDDVIVIVHHVAIDDAPRLSAREAAALMAGLQYLSALARERGQRLARVAAGQARPPARRRRPAGSPSPRPRPTSRSDSSARRSPRAGSSSSTTCNARGERGRRRADPLRIISQDADWYLQAYCHTREDVRNFRVDRMSELVLTDEPIGDHSRPHRARHPVPGLGLRSRRRRRRLARRRCRCCPTTSPTRPPARSTAGCGSPCASRTCTA